MDNSLSYANILKKTLQEARLNHHQRYTKLGK